MDLPPNKVLVRQGALSGNVYAVTRWKDDGRGNITALTKTDVSSQLDHVGWVLHVESDGGNDAFWWADKFPECPADGAREVYAIRLARPPLAVHIDGTSGGTDGR